MNFESLIHHHGFFLIVGEWHNYPIHILSYETCDCTSALRWEAFTSMSGSVQTCGHRHTHTHTHTYTLLLFSWYSLFSRCLSLIGKGRGRQVIAVARTADGVIKIR